MKKIKQHLTEWVDPYRQSFFFFNWKWWHLVLLLAVASWLTYAWRSSFVKMLLDNIFVYLPNYLTHEMLGHNLVGNIFYRAFYHSARGLGEWIATLAGNGVETLIPLVLSFGVLRLQGGRWILPPSLYWLATTFYGAGVYVQDARACSLPLTSSDMMTDYKAGEICGDWHHILEPLGLLHYDQWFAYTFFFAAGLIFVLAVYSAWYYWNHPNFYRQDENSSVSPAPKFDPNWNPPNIYTP